MWLKSTSSGTSKEATRHAPAKPALRRIRSLDRNPAPKSCSPGVYRPLDRCFRLIQIKAFPLFAQSPQSVLEGRTNVPTDSLLVTIAVVGVFAFFMTVLGYASFVESLRLPGAKNRARIQSSRKPEASNMR
jgi:hypothetical protein